jgi:ribonuclease Z
MSKDNVRAVSDPAGAVPRRDRDRFVVHTLGGHKIEGISIGGQETSIILPSLKIAFDSGRCPQRCVYADVMCLSHTHMDHVGGAGMYVATRSLLSLAPPTILLPRERVDAFGAFIASLRVLDDSELNHSAIGIIPGERFKMSKLFEIAPFATTHPVPSQGYLVYGTKNKLKAEYAGLDGQEIKQLRDNGEEISDKIEVPEVAFTGDTTGDWVDNPANADALKAKLLIMECTFVDDSVSKENAASFGHTHIDDIVARAHKFENEAILLIHFSARYKAEQVQDALKERLPPTLYDRCTPLLVGYD